MSAAPISIAHRRPGHVRNRSSFSSAFAPWSTIFAAGQTLGVPQPTDEQPIHVSPAAFNFKMASPPLLSSMPETAIYDACITEQEHCTGYECCNVKLGDMHAVMDHYEHTHKVLRLGNTTLPVPSALPVIRHQPVVAPVVMPVPSHFEYDSEMGSAPSPASTTSSERGGSLSIPDDDAEFELELDSESRMPQTPPSFSSHNVAIVSPEVPHHAFQQQFGAVGQQQQQRFGGPSYGHQQHFSQQKSVYPDLGAAQAVVRRAFAAQRPIGPLEVDTDIAMDTEMVEQDVPMSATARQEVYYRPSPVHQHPSAAYPPRQQQRPQMQQIQRPQIARQNSLHVATPPPALVPARANSFHEPPQHAPFPLRQLQHEQYAQRPLAPSPSPTYPQPQFDARSRNNGSAPFPSQIVTPTLYAPVNRSESPLTDEAQDEDDEDDEDAEGEYDDSMPSLGPAIILNQDSPNKANGRKAISSASREKRSSKTGRPKGSGRASAQKDPKRARLFCPRPGCTKRYMNPNGLKYHLEKGTCTLEA